MKALKIFCLCLILGHEIHIHAQSYKTIDTTFLYTSGTTKRIPTTLDIKWYDSNYNIVQLLTKGNGARYSNDRVNKNRILYTYNNNGVLTSKMAREWNNYEDSSNVYLKEYKYDGNDTFYLEKKWNKRDSSWQNKESHWLIYNDKNQFILDSSQVFGDRWRGSYNRNKFTIYDSLGRKINENFYDFYLYHNPFLMTSGYHHPYYSTLDGRVFDYHDWRSYYPKNCMIQWEYDSNNNLIWELATDLGGSDSLSLSEFTYTNGKTIETVKISFEIPDYLSPHKRITTIKNSPLNTDTLILEEMGSIWYVEKKYTIHRTYNSQNQKTQELTKCYYQNTYYINSKYLWEYDENGKLLSYEEFAWGNPVNQLYNKHTKKVFNYPK